MSGSNEPEKHLSKRPGYSRRYHFSCCVFLFRSLLNSQKWLSRNFDKILPEKFRLDGHRDYQERIVPNYLQENLVIYDVGGGKRPYLKFSEKNRIKATVVGIDINEEELNKAPEGAYDKLICQDIACFRGDNDGDILICQALLEHVNDVDAAFASFSSILKPGGLALIFVPSRNALYARLNMLLPQSIKKAILLLLYPQTEKKHGFHGYYHKCTPDELKALACAYNFSVIAEFYYYNSMYFSFFFPFYLVWRLGLLAFYSVAKEQAAETFVLVLKKETRQPILQNCEQGNRKAGYSQ